jgi:alpha-2-macroglobulin
MRTKHILGCFAAVLLAVTIMSYNKKQRSFRTIDPAFGAYVYAYSGGELPATAAIRVRLNEPIATKEMVGKPINASIFSVSPSIEGDAIWEDAYTIALHPKTRLQAATMYECNVALGRLYQNVPKKYSEFSFDFAPRGQTLVMHLDGLKTPNHSDLSKQELHGSLETNDKSDDAAAEKCLEATLSEGKTNIVWKHSDDHLTHQFIIKDIVRGEEDQTLSLKMNGKFVDCGTEEAREMTIPALNSFKVVAVEALPDNNGVNITFSDPLLANQNMDGLIAQNGVSFATTIDGNQAKAYTTNPLTKEVAITINAGIKNINNTPLTASVTETVAFTATKPAVSLSGKGTIMPTHEGLLFPFQAVNLKAVDVEIFKIYQNNVLQFLEDNNMNDEGYRMKRLGHIIVQKKIDLNLVQTTGKNGRWTNYALDLKTLINADPGAMYQVRIGFKKAYSIYNCQYAEAETKESNLPQNMTRLLPVTDGTDSDGELRSIMDGRYSEDEEEDEEGDDGNMSSSQKREDPCFNAYYSSHNFINRNVIASDLGLICKRGNDGSIHVAVADIGTAQPVGNVDLELFDRAQQSVGKLKTNGQGFATLENTKHKPVFLVASYQKQRGYLHLEDAYALSISKFNADGTVLKKGINGYLYGERGVWRPGDSLYLSFVLQDRGAEAVVHPVTLELYDPKNTLQQRITRVTNVHGIYDFRTATPTYALTGSWHAKVMVGGSVFEKTLKIETVKPNRLKLNLDFGSENIYASDSAQNGKLTIAWLHGAPARSLKAKVEVDLNPIKTEFPKYKEYVFDNASKRFQSEPQTVFDGTVDENGTAGVKCRFSANGAPGKMKANITVRGFERGGDASFVNSTVNYSPYTGYVGVTTRKSNDQPYFKINAENAIDMVAVSEQGAPIAGHDIEVNVYNLAWRWWWDSADSDGEIDEFNNSTNVKNVLSEKITSGVNGKCSLNFKPTDWGRFLIKVKDLKTGHISSMIAYTDYGGSTDEEDAESANILTFTADKEAYKVGETVTLSIPSSDKGNILVSIENGTRVLQQFWAKPTAGGKTKVTFVTTAEMSPNIYAHITHLQPHAQRTNQLPVRMYGLLPITVDNPDAELHPIIESADAARPESFLTFKVHEKSSKAMAYTVDIVDDGLLDLTNFKTPNPFQTFFKREALGVNTWDLYDYILGGVTGSIESVLSIGGDEANIKKKSSKANRFKPVVMHLGPFYLKSGTATHTVKLPNYVGSVRAMVVASSENRAFGASEKTIKVTKPLMILATAPRVVAPSEIIQVPVSVFAMDAKVKNVSIRISTNDKFSVNGENVQNLTFTRTGDEIVYFGLTVKDKIGIGTITVTATGGGETATETIELDVRNPNPVTTEVVEHTLKPGEIYETPYQRIGVEGTNEGILELSTIPPINFAARMSYLLEYPHGCLEQTTSQAFAQLYAAKVLNLDAAAKEKINVNVKGAIATLGSKFQHSDGGMQYWPGNLHSDEWATTYAMHFLIEAQTAGYALPPATLSRLLAYQQKQARAWQPIPSQSNLSQMYGDYYHDNRDLTQAYRLYTLALAQAPETGAMNRLRENPNTSIVAKWRLAAAYSAGGKTDIAKTMVKNLSMTVKPYREMSNTYGSDTRDEAMILETLVAIGDQSNAASVVKSIARHLGSDGWYSTQTTAFSLVALSKYMGGTVGASSPMSYSYKINGASNAVNNNTNVLTNINFNPEKTQNGSIQVKNTGKGVLFVRVVLKGQPPIDKNPAQKIDMDKVPVATTDSAALKMPKAEKTKKDSFKITNDLVNAFKNPTYTSDGNPLKMEMRFMSTSGVGINPNILEQGTDFVVEITLRNTGLRGDLKELSLSQIFPSGWEIANARMLSVTSAAAQNSSVPEYQDIRDDRVYTYFDLPANTAQTYRIQLNAAYNGDFYLPNTLCEAMYDNSVAAKKTGGWVKVVPNNGEAVANK